jgi:hypothetical protein
MFQPNSTLGIAKRHAVSLSVLALLMAAPAAAEEPLRLAQVYPVYPVYPGSGPVRADRPVQPHEVMNSVRSMGLTPVSGPQQRGLFWVVRAIGQDGTLVRVRVDGESGRVMDIVQIGPRAPRYTRIDPGMPSASGRYERIEEPDDLPPVPPGRIPRASGGGAYSGPQIVTRDPGPQVIGRATPNSDDLAPPSTGSVPRSVDPLNGVPPEFRRGATRTEPAKDKRIATGTPADATSRPTPLPRPRPADVPSLAKGDDTPSANVPTAASAPKTGAAATAAPAATGSVAKKPTDWPPVQPLE